MVIHPTVDYHAYMYCVWKSKNVLLSTLVRKERTTAASWLGLCLHVYLLQAAHFSHAYFERQVSAWPWTILRLATDINQQFLCGFNDDAFNYDTCYTSRQSMKKLNAAALNWHRVNKTSIMTVYRLCTGCGCGCWCNICVCNSQIRKTA
jgi:hypothetical protein